MYSDGLILGMLVNREQDKAGRRTRVNVSMPSRLMIILIAILTESAAWGVQVNAGTRFILTAADPIAVVRSTVALMFIQVYLNDSMRIAAMLGLLTPRHVIQSWLLA
jgi:hypothetical protein